MVPFVNPFEALLDFLDRNGRIRSPCPWSEAKDDSEEWDELRCVACSWKGTAIQSDPNAVVHYLGLFPDARVA